MNLQPIVDKYDVKNRPPKSIINPNKIPASLKKYDRWVCWGWVVTPKGNKWTKPPLNLDGKAFGEHTKAKCFSFEEAYNAYLNNPLIAGIGYSFHKDEPHIGIDIDDCLKKGKPDKKAKKLIKELNTYVEVSPSGGGLRAIGLGIAKTVGATKKHNLEIYTEKRYLTITGQVYKKFKKVRKITESVKKALPIILGQEVNGNGNGAGKEGFKINKKQLRQASRESNRTFINFKKDRSRIREALNKIPNDSYDIWLKIGMGLHQTYEGDNQALNLWDEWSSAGGYSDYNPGECETKWNTFSHEKGDDKITIFGIIKYFQETEGHEHEDLDMGLEVEAAPLMHCGDVKPKAITWLWDKRIPAGKVTIFSGLAGITKTTAALRILANISTGTPFPMDEGTPEKGNVAIISAEDGLEDTILPRFILNGGNPKRLFNFAPSPEVHTYLFDLSEDVTFHELEKAITVNHIKALVIDPLKAFLGKIKEMDTLQIRAVLARLGAIAERTNCAIICITHFNKDSGNTNATMRVSGSSVYIEAARAVLAFVVEEHEGEKTFYMNTVKENLGPGRSTLRYEVKGEMVDSVEFSHPKLKFVGYEERSINQILRDIFIKDKEDRADVVTTGRVMGIFDKALDYMEANRKEPIKYSDLTTLMGKFSGRLKIKDVMIKLNEEFKEMGIQKVKGRERFFYLHFPECQCITCKGMSKKQKGKLSLDEKKRLKEEKRKRLLGKVSKKSSKLFKKRSKK